LLGWKGVQNRIAYKYKIYLKKLMRNIKIFNGIASGNGLLSFNVAAFMKVIKKVYN
jgi:hypothetical protein